MSKILYIDKTDCCGCGACAYVCPKKIITMQADGEGFLYPVVDNTLCIDCNACENICPVTHSDEINSTFSLSYAGWSNNEDRVVSSSSGGAADSLYEHFINMGGVVYGVKYSDDFYSAVYARATTLEQVNLFKTSKYIQADNNDIYRLIKDDAKADIPILFIGLPCETYAVKRLLPNYDKLYLVSLICHGPTSAKVHESFCKDIEKIYKGNITKLSVRYKKNGRWKPYYINAKFDNGKVYLKKFEDTDYDTAFLNFKRPSCLKCAFKNNHFCADMVVGDYHSASQRSGFYHLSGVSSLLPLTERGKELISMLQDKFILKQTPIETAIRQKGIHTSAKSYINRDNFSAVLNNKNLRDACKQKDIKYRNKITKTKRRKNKIKSSIRKIVSIVRK